MKTSGWALIWATVTAISTAAQSSIIHVNGPAFSIPLHDSREIDMDADGTPDFVFSCPGALCTQDVPTSACSWPFYLIGEGANEALRADYVLAQPHGAVIGAQAPAEARWSRSEYGMALASRWWSRDYESGNITEGWKGMLGEGEYLGVRILKADGWHYGWIKVVLPEPGTEGEVLLFSPRVAEWAVETRPDVSIRAGAKPMVVSLGSPQVVRPGFLRLRWESEPSRAYQVQWKETLNSIRWTNMEMLIIATSPESAVDVPVGEGKRFYRIVEAD